MMAAVCSRLIRISETPNRPMASEVNESPLTSPTWPKVKRGVPVRLSRPTVPMARPSSTMAPVLMREPADTAVTTLSASRMSTTSTEGPILIITLASGGVMNIRPRIEKVPPTKLPTAEIISAGPARPWRAIS